MLNPIDTAAVIRDGGAVGHYPGEIHEAVGWWLGACLVVTMKTSRLAVAHDGHPVSVEFADRLCRGAINAEHYACRVRHLGQQPEEELLAAASALEAPAAWVSARTDNRTDTVRIRLYTPLGTLLDDTTGLAAIRDLIARDRIPIPVNTQAKGAIELWPPTSADGAHP
ncbi:hypothetical protein [Streptomyces sp. NBC_00568]|uniref:hypothetical protein n=1 Tax=Streptomyces sp. NBC_00568 TaxID=2975779 RepID=UPI00225B6890|nr:hypothetical protein [Streptomyces sp. NBC_00568]MCX4993383.1 hypothetical protein [Streptomyces sp. NBC_00568]